MELTVIIDNRKAIPVRGIAFITGWGSRRRITMDPYHLAHHLSSGKFIAGFTAESPLTAHHLRPEGIVEKISPSDWEKYVADIAELQTKCEQENVTHEDWRKRAYLILKSGVFVWFNEFELFWNQDFLPWVSMKPPSDEEIMEDYPGSPNGVIFEDRPKPISSFENPKQWEQILDRLIVLNSRKAGLLELLRPPPSLNYNPLIDAVTEERIFEGFESAIGKHIEKHNKVATQERNERWRARGIEIKKVNLEIEIQDIAKQLSKEYLEETGEKIEPHSIQRLALSGLKKSTRK